MIFDTRFDLADLPRLDQRAERARWGIELGEGGGASEEASGRLDALPSLPRRSTSNYLDLDP